MLSTLFKRALPGLAVFVLVWVAAIAWWRTPGQVPTPADLSGWLLALPAGLVATRALLPRVIGGIRHPLAPQPQTAPAAPGAATSSTPAGADAPAEAPYASVASVALRAAPGHDPAALVAALGQGVRAPLDGELTDGAGFPVCAARVADLDEKHLDLLRERWALHAPAITLPDETLRALALLEGAVLDAIESIVPALVHAEAASARAALRAPAIRLPLDALVPPAWEAPLCAALATWLRQSVSALDPRIVLDVTSVPGVTPVSAFARLDLAIVALGHAEPASADAGWRMVAATHSALSAAAIAAADTAQALYTATRQHGAVAGEAAAAVVLRTPAPAASPSPDAPRSGKNVPWPLIARPATGQRAESIETARKPDAAALERIAAPALAAARTDAAGVASLVADGGAQAARAVEFARFANTCFPELELFVDTLALDAACGSTGAAGALLGVALAVQRVRDTGRAAVAVTLADARERAALVVTPSASPPATLPDATPTRTPSTRT